MERKRDRVILHVDMNAYYASVAQQLDPRLRGRAVAVAGDPEKRNGIILAKSREAKEMGVKTAEAIWQARQKCPGLIVVPPDYRAYKSCSRIARMIYYNYTDQVEPFGLDECWLDVTGSLSLLRLDGMGIARAISACIEEELGLSVSIGVSWNKVFAKLGSEIDPGGGIVEITRNNYQDIAWQRPAEDMIYVGPATRRKFERMGYLTIGDIAHAECLRYRFGKIGDMLQAFACGHDNSPVRTMNPDIADAEYDIKGIGNGLTAPHDLTSDSDAKALIWLLAESVAQRLREARLRARTIEVGVRLAGDLSYYSRQATRPRPTCITKEIARGAWSLLKANQDLEREPVRGLHVRVSNLSALDGPAQYDLFGEREDQDALERLEHTIDSLRRRFGNGCVRRAVELTDDAMAHLDIKRDNTVHPIGFLR